MKKGKARTGTVPYAQYSNLNKSGQKTFSSITSGINNPAKAPLSFKYNGELFKGFSDSRITEKSSLEKLSDGKRTVETVYSLDVSLEIRLVMTEYTSYGFCEWTVYFKNTGSRNSGVISELCAEASFEGDNPVLTGILGDHVNLYRPYSRSLADSPVHFTSVTGRATHINFPYFNLGCGDGGVLLAIGWAGTWTADFTYENGAVTYRANAVNGLSTYLKPGESIRSALFVFGIYGTRNTDDATNLWRRWFIDCNMPRADSSGNAMKPFSTCCIANDTGYPNSDGSISERYTTWKPTLEKMIAEDCKVDFRWLDAGWYSAPNGDYAETDWWGTIGSWEPDKRKWPDGTLLESTDYARAHGMKTLMWFEPERVTDPDSLEKNYGYKKEWGITPDGSGVITNNIGNADCLEWTVGRITKVLRENRIEMYREDNNSDPAPLWAYLDSLEQGERKGITECRMVMGHYQMWDEIIACTLGFGGCGFVDSCASGGGRNDIESMRRGIPLLRSDSDRTSTSLRLSMTTSFNKWIPFCGANTKEKIGQLDPTGRSDKYIWRASYLASLNVDSQFTQDPGQDFSVLREGLKEWKTVAPYLLKDFYVLTPWHSELDKSGFTAYCFFDPKSEDGVLLMFRMEECEEDKLEIKLRFLSADATYTLTDADTAVACSETGAVLASGTTFEFAEKRCARLIRISRK